MLTVLARMFETLKVRYADRVRAIYIRQRSTLSRFNTMFELSHFQYFKFATFSNFYFIKYAKFQLSNCTTVDLLKLANLTERISSNTWGIGGVVGGGGSEYGWEGEGFGAQV